jgi:hypothetical protein
VDIPASQRLYYDQLFKIADADGDGVIGVSDSAFFKKSGLPNAVLGEVFCSLSFCVGVYFNVHEGVAAF